MEVWGLTKATILPVMGLYISVKHNNSPCIGLHHYVTATLSSACRRGLAG